MPNEQRKTKPSVLRNPTLLQKGEQARTSPFSFACGKKEKVKGCTGKARQCVNAQIRHMHCEHGVYSNSAARNALDSFDMLFIHCFTCAEQRWRGPIPPTNAAVRTLAF